MQVVVTGAASGIGRAACRRLARDAAADGGTARIAAVDLGPPEALESLVAELEASGAEGVAIEADMSTPEGPVRAVEAALERFGGLDAVVSNAGVNAPGPLVDYALEDWDRLFAVNTRALWLLVKAAHAALRASRGAVVSVASMSGGQPHANLGPYGPSKAAAIMLARVMAQELGPDGIRVNSVSPGMTRTGMTVDVYADREVAQARDRLVPLGRVAEPEDIADVIAFLLGPDARYVTGQDMVVDGGLTGNLLGRLPGIGRITRS